MNKIANVKFKINIGFATEIYQASVDDHDGYIGKTSCFDTSVDLTNYIRAIKYGIKLAQNGYTDVCLGEIEKKGMYEDEK